MMRQRWGQAGLLVALMLLAPLAGCFGEDGAGGPRSANDVVVTPEIFTGGVFQGITLAADTDLSAFIPYLIQNKETGFVQNSTVVDLREGESVLLSVLAPPRTDTAVILIGDYGRENWPIRTLDESWRTWFEREGHERSDNPGIQRMAAINGTLDTVQPSNESGGPAFALRLAIERPAAPAYAEADGGRHSTGVVNGRTTYNYLSMLTDQTPDLSDGADGAPS